MDIDNTEAKYKSGNIKAQSDAADIGWFTISEAAQLDMHPQLKSVLKSFHILPESDV